MSSEDYRRSQANQRNLTKVFRRLEEAERGAPLNNGGVGEGGITVWGGSIRILEGGNLEVDGDASFMGDTNIGGALDVTGATTIGGLLGVSGDATFSGKMKIAGTLELPAGIIGNDALASPASFGSVNNQQNGWTAGFETSQLASTSIAVPPGYSRAIVIVVATASAKNLGSATDFLYVGARIGDVNPVTTPIQAEAGMYANGTGHATRMLTGLSGGQIALAVDVRCNSSTGSFGPISQANLDAIAIFLR